MTEGTELSASESLAWQLAYDSNDAYDALQESRAKQVKYEEIGNVGLEGVTVTIDDEVIEMITKEVEDTRHEFDLVRGMAHAVATMDDSPFVLARAEKQLKPETKRATSPRNPALASRKNQSGERISKTALAGDKLLIALLESGGVIEAEDTVSAGSVIREKAEVSGSDWGNAKAVMARNEIIDAVASATRVHFFDRISLNLEKIEQMSREGALRPEVEAAYKAFLKSGQAGDGDSRFLDDRGGEETRAEEVDESEDTGGNLGINDELESIHTRHQPATPRRNNSHAKQDGKMFTFGFEAAGRSMRRSIKVSDLKKLPTSVRMLLGFGQVNTSAFDFYKTEGQKQEFVLRVVNKGVHDESKLTDQTGLEALIKEALEAGYLQRNGAGPELTADGIDFVLNTKYGRAKLGQKHALDAASRVKAKAKAKAKETTRQVAPTDLSKTTLIA